MPRLHLKIEMEVTVSKVFLEQFKLNEEGLNYNLVGEKHYGNGVLAGEVANKCFRNNSRTVYHVLATELSEEGET